MRVHLESLEQMRTFAAALAEHLRAGDLLILTGNLGAGKTTFTQSLGKALDVAGRITSPTGRLRGGEPPRARSPPPSRGRRRNAPPRSLRGPHRRSPGPRRPHRTA